MTQLILVVDDLESLRLLMKWQLMDAGYDVLLARSGEEALNLLAAPEIRFALVITDLRMPGMGGKRFGAQLVDLPDPAPVLYMSAYPPPAGLSHFIQKPFTSAALAAAVQTALRSIPGPQDE